MVPPQKAAPLFSDVPNLNAAPRDQEVGLLERLRDCLSLLSMQCPGDGSLPFMGPRTASPSLWVPESGHQGVSIPWVAASKAGAPEV